MTMRHIVGFAACFVALGVLGGQSAQAQTPNQVKFAQMIINNEAKQIYNERVNIALQNQKVQNLQVLQNGASTKRGLKMVQMLGRQINQLQNKINSMTQRLLGLQNQAQLSVALFPTSSAFRTIVALNGTIVNSFVARSPFGIPASSTVQ